MSRAYFITQTGLTTVGHTIKLTQCIHCGMTGMLILHGYLYGLDEYRSRSIKGRRVYCSNRNNRKGCGRTILYRIIDYLQRTLISTDMAWQFLEHILMGSSIENSYNSLDPQCELSLSTFFRFWRNFKLQTHAIRTSIADKFNLKKISEPTQYRETLRHLSLLLSGGSTNPVAQYQKVFQIPFV